MPHIQRRHFWIGFALASLGTALFSLKSILIKLAYEAGSNSESVMLLRMLMAAPIYGVIALYLWRKHADLQQHNRLSIWLKIALVGFLGYYLSSWLDLKGLEMVSAQLERLMLFTYPIMVALLGFVFFKQPLTRKLLLALALSYIGISLIYTQEINFSGDNTALGTLLVWLAATSFALYVLFSKSLIQQLGSLWFTSLVMLISSLFVVTHYAVMYDWQDLLLSSEILWLIFLLAIFSTVIPSFMISEAIARIGPAQTGVVGTLGPIVTIILAVVILNEPFSGFHLAGFSLVILGVGILTLPKKTESNSSK